MSDLFNCFQDLWNVNICLTSIIQFNILSWTDLIWLSNLLKIWSLFKTDFKMQFKGFLSGLIWTWQGTWLIKLKQNLSSDLSTSLLKQF